jgi:hypothetical protein
VLKQTIINTQVFFNTIINNGLPLPSIWPEEDGDVCFEWYKSTRNVLSISVSDQSYIYAYLINTEHSHGTIPFSQEIPEELLVLIKRFA